MKTCLPDGGYIDNNNNTEIWSLLIDYIRKFLLLDHR